MHRPRIIPVLLLKERGLVKSVRFTDYQYIGDPLNAVRIFNEFHADELIILDIEASHEGRFVSLEFVNAIAEETTMPLSVGGGIHSIDGIGSLIEAGVEKVIIGSRAAEDAAFIKQASDEFGSSTISVCVDVKKDLHGLNRVCIFGGRRMTPFEPVGFAQLMESRGAGELIIQSIDRDGTMVGYDIDIIDRVSSSVNIPVIALGGAGKEADLVKALELGHASAAAAGSLFVFQGLQRGVLINYPTNKIS
jgi:cyclase